MNSGKWTVIIPILITFALIPVSAIRAQSVTIENIVLHTDAMLTLTVFKGQRGLNVSVESVIATGLMGRSLKLSCWLKADGGSWVTESYSVIDLGAAKSNSWVWKNVYLEYSNANLIQWFGKGTHIGSIGVGVYDANNLSSPVGYKTLNFRFDFAAETAPVQTPAFIYPDQDNTINLSISAVIADKNVEIGVGFQYLGKKADYQAVLDILQAGKLIKREVIMLTLEQDKNGRISWTLPKNELGLGLFTAIVNFMDTSHRIIGSSVQTITISF